MKTISGRLFFLTVLIMFGAAFFSAGCFKNEDTLVTESSANKGGIVASKIVEFSGIVSDAAAPASPAFKIALKSAVSRAIELNADKNYIDVIDCATGASVGTGAFGPNGTFTANVDILKQAGKNIMIVIGNKNAHGKNGPALYKCLLGKMPDLSELPDASLYDSVKIKNVIVTYETTVKALFAVEKELYKNSANAIFSFTTSEVQADKSVSKQHLIDTAFDQTIESASGGAANIAAVVNTVKAIAVIASSNLNDAIKNNLLHQDINNISDTLNAYARIVAGRVADSEISNIITQNSIPIEIKLETEGAAIIVNGSTATKPITPESIKNIEPVKMVETPFFNIKDGEYSEAQTVTISSQTEGATVVYTLDGSEPGENSGIKYDSPIAINKTTLIKAAAYKTGMIASFTANLKITITIAIQAVEAPAFGLKDGQYSGTQSVALETKTPGASIYYTLDGTNPSKINSSIYSGTIEITVNVTIKAIAIKDGMIDSEISEAKYYITMPEPEPEPEPEPVAGPVFKLAGGTYNSTQQVEITCATAGAMIYYTTDGSIPTKDSLKYTDPVEVAKNLTIKAIAIKDGMNDSPVSEAAFIILIPVAAPVFKPSGGTIYTTAQEIEIVTETTGATIYYTLDGTAPTITGLKYEKPVTISKTTTIKAFAVKDRMLDSEIIEANYPIYPPVSDPTLSIAGGAYSNTLEVVISTLTPGAKIYYTLDGTAPSVNTGILYTSSVSILKPVTIKTIAVLEEMTNSNIIETAYTVPTEMVATPVILPDGGNFYYSTNITITCATDSSEVYYTTDGSVPSKLSTKYTAPFNLNKYGTATIKAIAYKTGMFDSMPAASKIFNIIYLPPNPNLTSITVNNAPKQGDLLTATPAYSNGAGTVTYLWKRSSDESGSTVTNSNLGTADTYTLVTEDVGNYVFCVATASGSTTGGSKTSSIIGPVTPAVLLESGSVAGITADDTKITGLTSGKVYVVKTGINYYGVLANGTLFSTLRATAALAHADAAALTGTQITNLTNGTTYKVTEEALVSLESGSLGTEGDTKITGLTATNKYVVVTGGKTYGVTASGTLGAENSDAASLTGTEITGLTNGTVYKAVDVTNLVLLETGSLGTASAAKITALTTGKIYVVKTGANYYGVLADGTLFNTSRTSAALAHADAVALTGTEITGLTNGRTYKVTEEALVSLESGSLGTEGDMKITGLTSGNKYVVITGGKVYGVAAGGTLGTENADAAALNAGVTEITGLTNGTVYKAVDVTNLVLLETGSLGTAGNGTITGLTSGQKYYCRTGGTSNSVMANGTFGPLDFLTGTSIIGLTNGKTYKVINYKTIVNSITYTYGGGSMTVTAFSGTGAATILDNVSGIPVTSIGDNAFRNRTGLSSITIPNSVTSIGSSAFEGCTGLTSISISSGVTSIGSSAFQGCTGLTSISIGSGVTSIEIFAFNGCTSLTSITVDLANLNFSSNEGVLYDKNQTILKRYPAAKSGAFTIPNSVTSIENNAFIGCTGLSSVSIGTGITSIGYNAFYGFTGLTSITIPNNVTRIEFCAFYGCTGLSSITIPNNVTSIEFNAFQGCTGLSSVSISTGVPSINDYVFQGCSGLSSITIPNNVTSIGSSAFQGCTGLSSITISNNVTWMGIAAFQGCTGLSSITIPNSVTWMGSSAFQGCSNLTQANFLGNAPATFGSSVFDGCAAGFIIHYVSGATGWTNPYGGYETCGDL